MVCVKWKKYRKKNNEICKLKLFVRFFVSANFSGKSIQLKINQLPSASKATSARRGPQRPYLTGVGDKPLSSRRPRSYSLNKSNGDNAVSGNNELARASRGGTLNARNVLGDVGGTLNARHGRAGANEPKMQQNHFFFYFRRLSSAIWLNLSRSSGKIYVENSIWVKQEG